MHTLCISSYLLAGLLGCSSAPSSKESSGKAPTVLDKIQGKVQVAQNETTATDAALNAGGNFRISCGWRCIVIASSSKSPSK